MNYTLPDHKRAHTPRRGDRKLREPRVGLAGGLAAGPFLVPGGQQTWKERRILPARVRVYGNLVLLYLSSTLYHALPRSRAKSCSGSSTTARFIFSLRGPIPRSRLAFCAAPGAGPVWPGVERRGARHHPEGGRWHPLSRLSTALYIVMGWIAVIAIPAAMAAHAGCRMAVDNRRRACVHRGASFLMLLISESGMAISCGICLFCLGPSVTSSRCCGTRPEGLRVWGIVTSDQVVMSWNREREIQ